MTATTKLHLYGPLAEKYGPEHSVPVGVTILDAIRIVECNHPGFLQQVRRGKFHLAHGDGRLVYDNDNVELGDSKAQQLYMHQIPVPRSRGEWHMLPAMAGANKGTMKIIFDVIVGGALLATGVGGALGAFGAGATGLGIAGTHLAMSFTTMALMGTGLFLGGLNMLMSPTPKSNSASNKPTSFGFSGPGEIDHEGGPVPLLLGGPIMVSGVRIGSSLTSEGANGNTYSITPQGSGSFDGYFEAGSGAARAAAQKVSLN